MDNTDRKLFILDTNVLLHEPLAIYSFKEHDVLIPMTVLEELDNIRIATRTSAAMRGWPSGRWRMYSAMQRRNRLHRGRAGGRGERSHLHLQ